jgi:uncharacterized membrane protein
MWPFHQQTIRDRNGQRSLSASGSSRLDSVDLVRGLAIVLMTLDHVRGYFNFHYARFDPLDLAQTTPAYFLTRWVTHFCAPAFIFLAGTGAFLAGSRGKSKVQLSMFLLTRGLWLVVLEVTVVYLSWTFNWWDFHERLGSTFFAMGLDRRRRV